MGAATERPRDPGMSGWCVPREWGLQEGLRNLTSFIFTLFTYLFSVTSLPGYSGCLFCLPPLSPTSYCLLP